MKTWIRMIRWICVVVVLGSLLLVTAGADDTVYVRKNVSLLYDNSGSMQSDLGTVDNLKWCYASYAAQAFGGLLNETDSLTITFMNNNDGVQQLEIDLVGDRQTAVSSILQYTQNVSGGTPLSEIYTALDVLKRDGLKSDDQLSGAVDESEQYWLVLTTDGKFEEYEESEVEAALKEILEQYSNLNLVYFGIGTSGDNSEYKATDFRSSSVLNGYSNFTAVYAESQENIISTMQELSNRIAGRYTVSDQATVNGSTVTLEISGESSPIRNIAVFAQNTEAELISAQTADGTKLSVERSASLEYPVNSRYDNVPAGTKGGSTALVTTGTDEKIPAGTITLTFSEPVDQSHLSLMYEPAVYVELKLQRKNAAGDWEDISASDTIFDGDELRVTYLICEDGTGKELDAAKLFGEIEESISFGDRSVENGESFTVTEGTSVLNVALELMDGAYSISTSRTLNIFKLSVDNLNVVSSGPLTMERKEVAANVDKFVEFTVTWNGTPVTADQLSNFKLVVTDANGNTLDGTVTMPEENVVRFTPQDDDCEVGQYVVALSHNGVDAATEYITIEANAPTYTAEPEGKLTIMSNEVATNQNYVSFVVTAYDDTESALITEQDADLFHVTAESADGTALNGSGGYMDPGRIKFTPQDANAQVGEYTVTLWLEDQALAETTVVILRYDATYTVEVVVSDDDTVDRTRLKKNENNVAFIVYADGVPCTAAQLEAMFGAQIVVSTEPATKWMGMEYSYGQRNGAAALICTPTHPKGFRRLIHKFLVWHFIPCGDLAVTLTVDMPKGVSAVGILQIVNDPMWQLFWILVLIALAFLAFLIGLMIRADILTNRIHKGQILYYRIEWKPYDGRYEVVKRESKPTGDKRIFSLKKRTETRNVGGKTFRAADPEKTRSRKTGKGRKKGAHVIKAFFRRLADPYEKRRTNPRFVRETIVAKKKSGKKGKKSNVTSGLENNLPQKNNRFDYRQGDGSGDSRATLMETLKPVQAGNKNVEIDREALEALVGNGSSPVENESQSLGTHRYVAICHANPQNEEYPSYELWFFVKAEKK